MTVGPSLQARLYARLDRNPHGRALAFYDSAGQFSWLTIEQLHRRALSHAAALADQGLAQGDVCLLALPSGEVAATLLVSVLLLGAVPLLLAPPILQGAHSNLGDILNHLVRKVRPRLVLVPRSMADQASKPGSRGRWMVAEETVPEADPATVTLAAPGEQAVAAMQLTSGTTGFPRVCVWRQKNVLAALDRMVQAMSIGQEDICFNWTPLYHDMGLVNNFLLCLTAGVPLVLSSPFDFVARPSVWLRGLSTTGATITWSPNFGFALAAQRAREEELEGVRLEGVRSFWNAAERIHFETIEAFRHRFAPYGLRTDAVRTNFGCAENIGGATFSRPWGGFVWERVDRGLLYGQGIARPRADKPEDETVPVVGVGRPYPGMHLVILSRSGRSLPDGFVGEIALDTPSRMDGYLGDARATHRALRGRLLRTGDLGYVRGGELFWVGRLRERITARGRKLDPSDFESTLLRIAGLRPGCFAVFGVDDEKEGTQRIVVVAEVAEAPIPRPDEVCAEVRSQLFLHLGVRVDEVVLVRKGTLTKTSSGKRRHRHFRQLYSQGRLREFQIGRRRPSPRTETTRDRSKRG